MNVGNNILKNALLNAVLASLYVAGIASFLFYAPKIFGPDEPDTVLVPIVMLLLFVFSATLMGVLILGRPILWYLDGKKSEATSLLLYTVGIFFVVTVGALFTLFFTR